MTPRDRTKQVNFLAEDDVFSFLASSDNKTKLLNDAVRAVMRQQTNRQDAFKAFAGKMLATKKMTPDELKDLGAAIGL